MQKITKQSKKERRKLHISRNVPALVMDYKPAFALSKRSAVSCL